jgi:hypothetical protein
VSSLQPILFFKWSETLSFMCLVHKSRRIRKHTVSSFG